MDKACTGSRLCGKRCEDVSHVVQKVESWLKTIIKRQGMIKLLLSFTGRCLKKWISH